MSSAATVQEFEPPYLHPDYRATVLRSPGQRLVHLPEEWFHRLPGPAFGRVFTDGDDAADAKAAIISISEGLALYLRPLGIGVTCLCPGPVLTNMGAGAARLANATKDPEALQWAMDIAYWISNGIPHENGAIAIITSRSLVDFDAR